MPSAWFDDIDFAAPWRRMGTRRLASDGGDAPDRAAQLAERARLWGERPDEVYAVAPGHVDAVDRVAGGLAVSDGVGHPLVEAGLAGVEDLCLLQRRPTAAGVSRWHLDAAFLAFPSRWRLTDKIGRPLELVHEPVDGYAEHLAERVHGLLDALAVAGPEGEGRMRRNWFVHPDPALFQPSRPPGGDPVVAAGDVADGLFVRSEFQTLRALDEPDWILFTIRIDQAPLGAFLADPDRRHRFTDWLATAAPGSVSHHGISPAQAAELRQALGVLGDSDPTRDEN